MNHSLLAPRFPPAISAALLAGMTILAAAACGGQPADVPVRTTTPSGSWTAPSAKQAAERDRALLRVVAAIPGGSRLDLFVGGQRVTAGVEYRTITPYLDVPAGRQPLRLRPAGLETAEPLAEETEQLDAGGHYTALIMPGEEGGPAAVLKVFKDPMDAPDDGKAALRVVHAAGDAGRVDVQIQGRADPLAGGFEFQQVSEFVTLEPGAARVELRPAGRSETMFRLPDLQLVAGGMYTVVIVGRARTEPPLEALVIEDRIASN